MPGISILDWINSRSPYPVSLHKDTVFRFKTDRDLEYELAFVHMLDMGSHPVFYSYLVLCNEDGNKQSADRNLALAFSSIIHGFLLVNHDSLVMFCHQDGDRQFALERIIISWARRYGSIFGFDGGGFIQGRGKDEKGIPKHFCIFYSGDCTEVDALKDFIASHSDEIISMFTQQRTDAFSTIAGMK